MALVFRALSSSPSAPGEGGCGSCGGGNTGHHPPQSKFMPVPKIWDIFGIDEFLEAGQEMSPPQIACVKKPAGGSGGSLVVAMPCMLVACLKHMNSALSRG